MGATATRSSTMTKISWWLDEPRVAQFIGAFDRSNLIFTVRSNDLIFQTAAIKLFMPKERRRRYSDFSYQHHTIRNGSVLYGGVEAGWRDDKAQDLLASYASRTTGTHRARDANGATAGRGTRSGPTRTSTSARTGIETRRRVSGRIGRRRT